jgi:hypothetical protein
MAPPNDPKQSESGSSSGSGSGGGFFASIASSLSNFGTAMTRSVNGYPDPFLLLLFFFPPVLDTCCSWIWIWLQTIHRPM